MDAVIVVAVAQGFRGVVEFRGVVLGGEGFGD